MSLRLSAGVAAVLALASVCAVGLAGRARAEHQHSTRIVEMRVYTLNAGARAAFHQLFVQQALPMLRQWNVDVIAYGPSLHDEDSYYLARSFSSLGERTRSEEAFYGSSEWKEGPRQAVLAAIESYSTVVLDIDEATVQGLRRLVQGEPGSPRKEREAMQEAVPASTANAADLATLLALNDEYVRSVQTSDARRFRDILASDFLCSLPDGSQIDRETFLQQIAAPAKISNLKAHDVNVRLMGDFAIVHARTTFTMADGRPGASRYTDVWARREGRWMAVAAHVTRY
jgi:ketosteroid isomerase-like protein